LPGNAVADERGSYEHLILKCRAKCDN
jgi:hypothetical protein